MLVGILAILKAGGQYAPLDGGIVTQSTLEYVIKDTAARLVLSGRQFVGRVPANVSSLCLEDVIAQDSESAVGATKLEDMSSPSDGCAASGLPQFDASISD